MDIEKYVLNRIREKEEELKQMKEDDSVSLGDMNRKMREYETICYEMELIIIIIHYEKLAEETALPALGYESLDYMSKSEIRRLKIQHVVQVRDVLNSVCIMRSAYINNGSISKDEFIEMVRVNYKVRKVDDELTNKINDVWNDAIQMFRDLKILDGENTNENKISINFLRK